MFQKIWQLLFPASCVLCGGRGEIHGSLCRTCYMAYVRERMENCPQCGKTAASCLCGTSFVRDMAVFRTQGEETRLHDRPFLALTFYHKQGNKEQFPERCTEQLLFRLKQRGECVPFFAAELASELNKLFVQAGEKPENWCLTYAPRTEENIRRFGYDQGEETARVLARSMHIPFRPTLIRLAGEEQKKLTASGRKENAQTSLTVPEKSDFTGMKFLLFDDIITSGSTITAAARLLYKQGAADVFPVCIARTYPSRI